jgi:ABC-2 type transport system ATP-binding protein
MTAILAQNLVKQFGGRTAVDNLSFEIEAGQVTALLGPNGAGKTTTMEILAGFTAPSRGTVRVLGQDPRRAGRSWHARIGVVLQSTSLDDQLTVAEAIRLFRSLFPRPRSLAEVLDMIDLDADAGTKIGALSGGQRRRVDLGLGIVGRPELLFLDEPTTGLDPQARRRAWTVIGDLASNGTTVLLTTHYLEEAQRLAHRVIVLADGRIVTDATPDQVRARGGAPVIRYALPSGAPVRSLPPRLARHIDRGGRELAAPSTDLTGDLEALVGWARRSHLDLVGLEVASPSLEDAYLTITSEPGRPGPAKEAISGD